MKFHVSSNMPGGKGIHAAVLPSATGLLIAFAALLSSFNVQAQAALPTVSCSSSSDAFSTGHDASTGGALAQGAAEPSWKFAFAGRPVTNPSIALSAIPEASWGPLTVYWTSPWSTSPYANANWVSPMGFSGAASQRWGYYRYQFNLDPAVNPADLSVQLSYLVDDVATEIYVNGVAQSTYAPVISPGSTFSTPPVSRTLTQDWKPGLNEIVFQVLDYGWVTGLLVQAEPTAVCNPTTVDITKTASASQVNVGGTFSYDIVLTNQGSQDATVAQLTDTPPADITLNAWACTAANGASCPVPSSGTGPLNLSNLALPPAATAGGAGGQLTFTLQASVNANATPGSLTNTVQATPDAATTQCSAASGGAAAAQCAASASITVVKPVTPEPAAPTPVPADAPWALLALGGLLAALGARKVRSQGSV
ncbi:DUF11 domain-containing protein [Comamonas koreensis]|uniref:DUF11 domain-containing protein n=1 Tax=Comamonas koreensis TaxID=160825 RepID=UPI0015FBB0AE|nr:DUF11 domain-containing protein [Comamonas koreensis]